MSSLSASAENLSNDTQVRAFSRLFTTNFFGQASFVVFGWVLRGPYPGVMSAMEVPVVQLLSYGPSKLLTRPHLLPGMNE